MEVRGERRSWRSRSDESKGGAASEKESKAKKEAKCER